MSGSMQERLDEKKFLITFDTCEHASFASSNVAETRMNTEFCGGGGAKL